MGIEVVPYTAEWIPAVRAFNARMEAAGVHWRWYEDPTDFWIPERQPGQRVWREHYLVVEDGETVRGGYALKPHEWLVRGETHVVTDWQGPITEAAVEPSLGGLGFRLLREMLRAHPLLYSWGHGDEGVQLLGILERMGWLLHQTPFCLRVERPHRFLRHNRYLRETAGRRLLLDLLAWSGLGWVGIEGLHAALALRGPRCRARAEVVPEFGAWADEVWERSAPAYTVLGVRDAATCNVLMPKGGWPDVTRLRVRRGDHTVGWAAVLDTVMSDDARFGTLRVGTVVDCLAPPEDAHEVAGAAARFLADRGVDMVFSNQAHPGWVQGFASQGFAVLPRRRIFAASPRLSQLLEPLAQSEQGIHLTNLDGHGPIRL